MKMIIMFDPPGTLYVLRDCVWTTVRMRTLRAARLAAHLLNQSGNYAAAFARRTK